MALHLNLYHEVQKQQRQRQRDPLKLGMLALLVIGVGFVVYYVMRIATVGRVTTQLAQMEAEWQTLEPLDKEAKVREQEVLAAKKTAEMLTKRIEGRFYWAPILEMVQQNIVPEVQLTSLEGDYSQDLTGRAYIRLSGISAGPDPRKVADDLRTGLQEKFSAQFKPVVANFGALDEGARTVQLNGKPAQTATFTINLEITNPAAAAAAPTPPRQRKKVP